jgi:hypothetical protein
MCRRDALGSTRQGQPAQGLSMAITVKIDYDSAESTIVIDAVYCNVATEERSTCSW